MGTTTQTDRGEVMASEQQTSQDGGVATAEQAQDTLTV
jgi:hypothetical protein